MSGYNGYWRNSGLRKRAIEATHAPFLLNDPKVQNKAIVRFIVEHYGVGAPPVNQVTPAFTVVAGRPAPTLKGAHLNKPGFWRTTLKPLLNSVTNWVKARRTRSRAIAKALGA